MIKKRLGSGGHPWSFSAHQARAASSGHIPIGAVDESGELNGAATVPIGTECPCSRAILLSNGIEVLKTSDLEFHSDGISNALIKRMVRIDVVDTRSISELLKLAQEGDSNAFGQLVKKHYPSCVNIATSIVRNRDEAEETVQKAVCKSFEHLDQYLGEAEFFTWLIRIVVNECRMLLRERKRARFQSINASQDGGEDRLPELLSRATDPECQALTTEMISVLKTEIRHIPPIFRQVIVLRDVNELPMLQVADYLGITVSAAKSRLLRARNELRRRVTSRLGPARHMMPLSTEQTLPARPV